MKEAEVISFINMKGGVGKTTLTKEIGFYLADQLKKKVLLIDIDPQINLTQSMFKYFNYAQSEQIAKRIKIKDNKNTNLKVSEASIKNIFNGQLSERNPTSIENAILSFPNTSLDLIPGELGLEFITRNLNSNQLENGIYNFIDDNNLKDKYDYVIIDCRPSLSMMTLNALASCDSVIIPVQAHYLSAKGMTQLIKTITQVKRQINPNLKIDGVLLTLADMQTKVAKTTIDTLQKSYSGKLKIYNTIIPQGVKAVEGTMVGKSLYTYDKNSKPAIAYEKFCKEVLNSEKQRTKNDFTKCR